MSMPAAQAIGHKPGWLLPSAYHLIGLQHPWSNDPDAFATTETGQLLINRSAQLYTCSGLGSWIVRLLQPCGESCGSCGALSSKGIWDVCRILHAQIWLVRSIITCLMALLATMRSCHPVRLYQTCRLRHADVIEWIWWVNAHHKIMYKCNLAPNLCFCI